MHHKIPYYLTPTRWEYEGLTEPGVRESFLLDHARLDDPDFIEADVELLRESWMGMWRLGEDVDGGIDRERSVAAKLMLKPQREGGANNVYRTSVPGFSETWPGPEREAWITMERAEYSKGVSNYFVRCGSKGTVRVKTTSVLGIFGWALFGLHTHETRHEEAG